MMAIISHNAYRRTNEFGKVDRRGRVKKPIHARKRKTKSLLPRAVRVSIDMTRTLPFVVTYFRVGWLRLDQA
jgi:hypothetical protein